MQYAAARLGVVVHVLDECATVRVESELGVAPTIEGAVADGSFHLEYRDLVAGERRLTRLVRG